MDLVLSPEFFQKSKVVKLAKSLLGKNLCTNIHGNLCKAMIVETEAYEAPLDKASHAYNNRFTKRSATMYMEGGVSYVYLCYGIHNMFNVVTGGKDVPHAILIRACDPISGIASMQDRFEKYQQENRLLSGPGKVCKALGIDRSLNQLKLEPKESVWIEKNSKPQNFEIIASPRVGIAYAAECANWDYRFYIKGNKCVSKPLLVKYK